MVEGSQKPRLYILIVFNCLMIDHVRVTEHIVDERIDKFDFVLFL